MKAVMFFFQFSIMNLEGSLIIALTSSSNNQYAYRKGTSIMKGMNKNYPMVDIFKFIAALMVMVIHFRPFSDINPSLDFISAQIVARLAVPFFLICAGYFMAHKDMRKSALKLLKLYGIWSLVYLPIVLIGATYNQTTWGTDLLLIVRDIFFQGTTLHLWYLPAVVFAIVLIGWLRRFMDLRTILIMSFCLYGLGLFTDGYYGLLNRSFIADHIETGMDRFCF
jgi:serine/alanine racemase